MCFGLLDAKLASASCRCPSQPIEVWPNKAITAPTNTRVLVKLPPYMEQIQFTKYADFRTHPRLWASSIQQKDLFVFLVHKGKIHSKTAQFNYTSGNWRMILLQLRVALFPNQDYQVMLRSRDGKWSSIIATFKTGERFDRVAPRKTPLLNAQYIWEYPANDTCMSGAPYAKLTLSPPEIKDSNLPRIFGIWLPDSSGKITYQGLPSLIITTKNNKLVLGRDNQCDTKNFSFEGLTGSVRLGIRAMDLSGNQGPKKLVNLTIGSISAPWSWSPGSRSLFWLVLAFLIFTIGFLRGWMFQRKSSELIDDFLYSHNAIKGDMEWLTLRKLVEQETPLRRKNMLFSILQILLVLFGLTVFVLNFMNLSAGVTTKTQLFLLVGPLSVFLLLGWGVNLLFSMRAKSRRRKVAKLPVAGNFQQAHTQLLASWK